MKTKAEKAKKASYVLANLHTDSKNQALYQIADALEASQELIIEANQKDLEQAQNLSSGLKDRLRLTSQGISMMASGLRQISELADPIGRVLEDTVRPNHLHIQKVVVPLGVIGIIYEARPNVTADAIGLCLKTGNALILKGGSAAFYTNEAIVKVVKNALHTSEVPSDFVQLSDQNSRQQTDEMLKLRGLIDVIIPRGGKSLIDFVVEHAKVPVIETGAGICHTYIDEYALELMAQEISFNAKLQRPSVCNAMETLLVHEAFPQQSFIQILEGFIEKNVELRVCAKTRKLFPQCIVATEEDFSTEYNDYILNVKQVTSIEEAVQHIRTYSTKHSECIVTQDQQRANQFLNSIDSAVLYHNASTRFTDGFEFGFGAEIGISTQKLHARGPMGLESLTSSKYFVYGDGQIR